MAQYKVPQDVEAEDKLLGPFTFRQFIYLLVVGGLCVAGFFLFRIFPVLVIIVVPPILLFGALALPIKKDQPMETYLSAVVSFYLKPRIRTWEPGELESLVIVTAPKQVEENRTKNLSQEEASHRLSFLADIVDTEGYAIKGNTNSSIRDEVSAEASNAYDMLDTAQSSNINQILTNSDTTRRETALAEMRAAIDNLNNQPTPQISPHVTSSNQIPQPSYTSQPIQSPQFTNQTQTLPNPAYSPIPSSYIPPLPNIQTAQVLPTPQPSNNFNTSTSTQPTPVLPIKETSPAIIQPTSTTTSTVDQPQPSSQPPSKPKKDQQPSVIDPDIIKLASNDNFSIETLAKQAKRIKEKHKNENEVYVSLH